jgi:hypothetical protein
MDKIILKKKEAGYGSSLVLSSSINRLLGMVFFLCISASGLMGQSVTELGAQLNSMKQSSETTVREQAVRFEELIHQSYSTIYFGSEGPKTSKETVPVCADANMGEVDQLYLENPLYNQVELITIRIKSAAQLSNTIDLGKLQSFSSLKFIRVLCEFDCSAPQVKSLLSGINNNVTVCYVVAIPS